MSGGEFSGLLRENIRIERQSAARDAMGSAADEREIIGEFRAAAQPLGTGDAVLGESRSAMARWSFTLRQTALVLPGDYLLWAGREMRVLGVTGDHRFIPKTILQAEEIR